DNHLLSTQTKELLTTLPSSLLALGSHQQGGQPSRAQLDAEDLEYTTQVKLHACVEVLHRTAKTRPTNWQRFCALASLPSADYPWSKDEP
ncbi:unnamed protein product, partial [Chrysoparadoxa australica]